MQLTIGVIGYGNMGSAIAGRLKKKYQIQVFDKDSNRTKDLLDMKVADNAIGLVNMSDAVILAVKPQDFDKVLSEIKNHCDDKLIISIAAGVTTGYIQKHLERVRVVRVMPNIGAKIGKAESGLCKGRYASDEDIDFVRELFDYIGRTWIVNERMMDAVTAISGSGPAYIYYDMEINKIDSPNVTKELQQEYIRRLARAAERVGFDSRTAMVFFVAIPLRHRNSGSSLAAMRCLPTSIRTSIFAIVDPAGSSDTA